MCVSDVLTHEMYDACVLIEFLEHIERDLHVIDQIKPGKRVYAGVPNFPDPGHVRYFQNVDAVRDRYSPLLDAMTVDVLATTDPTHVHYIIEGVRNSAHASSLPSATLAR